MLNAINKSPLENNLSNNVLGSHGGIVIIKVLTVALGSLLKTTVNSQYAKSIPHSLPLTPSFYSLFLNATYFCSRGDVPQRTS